MRFFRPDGIKIKTSSQIEAMKEAGHLSAQVLREVGARISPGVSTLELDEFAEEYIRAAGGVPAFKGYGGFPGTICASINEMVVHGIPSKDAVLKEGDIVSIDTGATVNRWVGDNAATFAVGNISEDAQRLIDVTEAAMWAGIEQAVPGNHLGDIGHAVQEVAESAGFGVVREYTGHGIGRKMHEPPSVYNYGQPGWGTLLEEGMVIAIEPMVTMGTFRVRTLEDGWGVVTRDGKPAAHFERTVAITADGPVVLTEA